MSRTGVILTGGKSSRMGQDKALMILDGKPMARRVANTLAPFCDEILVSSNLDAHAVFGDRLVGDTFTNCGPLSGLYSALSAAKNNEILVLSCDVPFVSGQIIHSLLDHAVIFDAIVARCDQQIHPLIAVYRKSALETIESSLQIKQLKMLACLEKMNVHYVDFPVSLAQHFENLNSPEDLKL